MSDSSGERCIICRDKTLYREGDHWKCRNCQVILTDDEVSRWSAEALSSYHNSLLPNSAIESIFPSNAGKTWGEAVEIVRNYYNNPDYQQEVAFYRTIAPAVKTLQDHNCFYQRGPALNTVNQAFNDVFIAARHLSADERLAVLKRVCAVLENLSQVTSPPYRYSYTEGCHWPVVDRTRWFKFKLFQAAALALESLEKDTHACWYLEEAQRLYVICLERYYERIPGRTRKTSYWQKTISIWQYLSLLKRIRSLNVFRRQIDCGCKLIEDPPLRLLKYDLAKYSLLITFILVGLWVCWCIWKNS